MPTAPSARPLLSVAALRTAALRPLQQPCLRRWSANLCARIDGAIANRLGLQQRLSFRLRFFEFEFFGFALFGFE